MKKDDGILKMWDELLKHIYVDCGDCQVDSKDKVVNRQRPYEGKYGTEAIDIIEEFDLNFNLGNAVKYILRAGRRLDGLNDLKKAQWYIKRQIENVEGET